MGKAWDGTGIAFAPELWREVLRVIKPGGHLVAFGGTRTVHRLACALEDAGWEIRDTLHWCYYSGFPKSLDISKAIDALHGAEREVVGERITGAISPNGRNLGGAVPTYGSGHTMIPVTAPATPDAQRWAGWGSAVKPSVEPAICARAPLSESSIARNVLRWGTGALNIDGCRFAPGDPMWVGPQEAEPGTHCSHFPGPCLGHGAERSQSGTTIHVQHEVNGRYPANLLACPKASRSERERGCAGLPTVAGHEAVCREEGSAGLTPRAGAGRSAEKVANRHPCVKPVRLLRYLCRLVTPPGGTVLDPFAGSGSCGVAAVLEGFAYLGAEMERAYHRIAMARIEHATRYPEAWTDTGREIVAPTSEREEWERAGQMSLIGRKDD